MTLLWGTWNFVSHESQYFPRRPRRSSNLKASLDFVSGKIEILRKQNLLMPSGPVIH